MLRSWTDHDAPAALRLWGDARVMAHVEAPLADLDAAMRCVRAAQAAERDHGVCLWAVATRDDAAIIGACGLHRLDQQTLELAFHFVPTVWRRGYATEAARAVVTDAVEDPKLARIVAWARPENAGSLGVLRRLGFTALGPDPTQDDELGFELRADQLRP
ncbi:MAG: GNAT family N-acetyltransferase [Myxococcales bacterium]|nr:GNAT family N-acetyltransferase [Myxococcales bacterium]